MRLLAFLGSGILVVIIFAAVWLFGMVFECEYPYTFVLAGAQNATSTAGIPVSQIIKSDGAPWPARLPWHTSSYNQKWCGSNPSLTCLRLAAPDSDTCYWFAYCSKTRAIVPMTDQTAAHFPQLMPSDDELEDVYKLDNTARGISVGAGDLRLPVKWFRSITPTERSGSINMSQPASFATNHTMSLPVSSH